MAEIAGQARVLAIVPDPTLARALLTTFSEAGLDCRYAPAGSAGLAACHETGSHVIVLDESVGDVDPHLLCARIRSESHTPMVMLMNDIERTRSPDFQIVADVYLPRNIPATTVLAHVEAQLQRVYNFNAVLPADDVSAHTKPAPPPGWGRCEVCNYMGPRAKFENADRSSRHSLICPACKQSENIAFSM